MAASGDKDKKERFNKFLSYFNEHITGDEKGEGQLFFENLLQAFGNAGVKQAGATCEERVKKKSGKTGFADLVWKPRVIIELKKRGEKLEKHYEQAFEYWLTLVPNRPEYMVLCNFDEFWVYDLNQQLNDPVHKINIQDLPSNWGSLGFLFPKPEKPVFDNHNVAVTEEVAKIVGSIYLSLVERDIEPDKAQRFVLQLVVAMFAEDVDLIPKYTLHNILAEAVKDPVIQKELTDLFEAMSAQDNKDKPKKYSNLGYFNGGLFTKVDPVELTFKEIDLLHEASRQNWQRVRPSIFGSIFEGSMDPEKRHGHGIHFTSELDIQKIVNPTIVKPFREKIKAAKNKKQLGKVLEEIENFRVLDPACGSGNFLYLAFRELRRLEVEVLEKMDKNFDPKQLRMNLISPRNFFGIDTNKFGLELAKIALSIGRKLSADEFGIADNVLPFDDLDSNFVNEDALFSDWPMADVIIGNPPYLGSRYISKEHGYDYVEKLYSKFSEFPKMADYCTHWFRLAHDRLQENGRAGLVGTNTIRQNESRVASLDYILENGGTITEAVSTQVWSGDANVHVSIVNWIKGESEGPKKLFFQDGDRVDSPWTVVELDLINPSLSKGTDVTKAKNLSVNQKPKVVFQGQNPVNKGFFVDGETAKQWIEDDQDNRQILFPYMIGRDLLDKGYPTRWIIDFGQNDQMHAMKFEKPFAHVQTNVMPIVLEKAEEELKNTGKKSTRWSRVAKKWWEFRDWQLGTMTAISSVDRYIACSRVTKRPIFDFVSSRIHPDTALMVFPFDDYFSFGILQSEVHAAWFAARCSSLKGDNRYTSETVFDTFPWPQGVTNDQAESISQKAREFRALRNQVMNDNSWTLRKLYAAIDVPGDSEIKRLNHEVLSAYGFNESDDILERLLELNFSLSEREENGETIDGPGLPHSINSPESFVSEDCIEPLEDY